MESFHPLDGMAQAVIWFAPRGCWMHGYNMGFGEAGFGQSGPWFKKGDRRIANGFWNSKPKA
jgi:hypothetical protein